MVIFFFEKEKEAPKVCPMCKKDWLNYELTDQIGLKHKIKLCWRDSAFDISPANTETALLLQMNPILILDLLKMKQLKPVERNG